MSVAQLYPSSPVDPDPRRSRLLEQYARQRQAALQRGYRLLTRKTCGNDEAVLARMEAVARAYEDYRTALTATLRLEFFL